MRLSQLARDLGISPSQLISFYRNSGINSYSSHNNKIIETHLDMACEHFRKVLDVETGNEKSDSANTVAKLINDVYKSKEGVKHRFDENQEIRIDNTGEEIKKSDDIEVIRIPKIKLEGIKIVGKIDLPEQAPKKKKEIKKAIDNNIDANGKRDSAGIKKRPGRKRSHDNLKKSETGKKYRELSYEEKLKREEYRKNKERTKQKKIKKEQKKQYYLKYVQSKNSRPEIRKMNTKNHTGPTVESNQKIPVYKNPLKRFWAWLNGAYDKEI